jgi:3-oxoacyl-[acyl-carrier protein] reductase
MSDFLLQLGDNPQAVKLIKSLGLPIPIPQKLRRARGPWEERPLDDWNVVVGSAAGGALAAVIAKTIVTAGANPHVIGGDLAVFKDLGEAYGRPAASLALAPGNGEGGTAPEGFRAEALVFDATGIKDTAGLRAVYDFFHPLVGALRANGRVVVLGRPAAEQPTAEAAAAQAALDGFIRSLAKEVGKKGSTAQLLVVSAGAEGRVEPALRFVLSPRAAFLTGQPIPVTATAKAQPEPLFVRPLEGKVALVTGAARGIGEATAKLLAAEGAHVICLDRPADDGPLSQVARAIGGSPLLVDVTDENAPDIIAAYVKDKHGGLDIIVHNAGVTRDKTLARMKPELWDMTIDINLGAVARINAELLAKKAIKDGGRIICLSSVAGIAGNLGQTNYAASKAGVMGYVRKLAVDTAKRGITVNAIAPGFIETRLTAAIPVMIREVGRRLSALGQGGLPDDIGQAITFLASPGSSGLNGVILRVCGGALIGA